MALQAEKQMVSGSLNSGVCTEGDVGRTPVPESKMAINLLFLYVFLGLNWGPCEQDANVGFAHWTLWGTKSPGSTGITVFSNRTDRSTPSMRDSSMSSCSIESQPS